MELVIVAHHATETNAALAASGWQGAPCELVTPRDALLRLRSGDVALNRLDVSAALDGVEEGIWIINQLEAQDVRVLNRPPALLAAHDKLITARLVRAAGIPHPRTRRLACAADADGLRFRSSRSRASAAGGVTSSSARTSARCIATWLTPNSEAGSRQAQSCRSS